jgi:hypothetical protein
MITLNLKYLSRQREHLPADVAREFERNAQAITMEMAQTAEVHLRHFLGGNSDKSPEELEQIAAALSPGGTHNGGHLVRIVLANVWGADPLLLAATLYYNWHGGKVGFQFLPDPATTVADEYRMEVESLVDLISGALDDDPRRVLTGDDRAFFDSLPDRFTVYRGCSGISPELAGMGLCWTSKRDVAEWFATRGAKPILLTARVKKSHVLLAKASEFEVVVWPQRARVLKCPRRGDRWRPNMEWRADPV